MDTELPCWLGSVYKRGFSISGVWDHWDNYVVEYIYPTDCVPDYASILVPNVDNTRTSFLLETIAKQRKVPFVLKKSSLL